MKRSMIVLGFVLPALAFAQAPGEYARQWPIVLPDANAGAYRIALDADTYRAIASPALRDVDVVDAKGVPVAAGVFGPDAPIASAPRFVSVPWFAVQAPRDGDDDRLSMIARRDPSGRILSVEAQAIAGDPATSPRAFLFDLSHWPRGAEALTFDFAPGATVQASFRVETSDDLESWRTLNPRVQLLALEQDGDRLTKTDVPMSGPAKYVRLVPLGDEAFAFAGVHARIAMPADTRAFEWITLQGHATRDVGKVVYEFESTGRFPVAQADVVAAGNAAVEWRLESRDDNDLPWRWRAGPWIAFRVDSTTSSPTSISDAPARDRHWRLVAESGTPTDAPALKLGYRPEVVVFLAQGTPPYTLVAGSAHAVRGDAPLPRLVESMRASKGADWQPSLATLGPATTRAGATALEHRTTPEDWKQWVLWAVLAVGALVVVGFAVTLLRKPRRDA